MSVDHLRLWGNNAYARIKELNLPDVKEHVCLTIPRGTYRKCAMTFNDVRSTKASRYYQMALQVFLEMLKRTYQSAKSGNSEKRIDCYPFMSVYLEYPSTMNHPDQSSCYRLHAFSFHSSIHFGSALENIISENALRQQESRTKKRALRINPLENLADYQLFYRITSKEMFYRTIGDWIRKDNYYISHLDSVMNHKAKMTTKGFMGNPVYIFSLKHALKETPANTIRMFRDTHSYYRENEYHFASYDHIIRLSPEQLDTAVFMSKYLPDYQARMEKYCVVPRRVQERATIFNMQDLPELPEIDDDDHQPTEYENNCMDEYDTRMTKDTEKEKFEEFFDQSDFVIMHARAKMEYKRSVQQFEGTNLFREKYREYQTWACEEFEARCFDEDSNISDVGLKMIRWMENTVI